MTFGCRMDARNLPHAHQTDTTAQRGVSSCHSHKRITRPSAHRISFRVSWISRFSIEAMLIFFMAYACPSERLLERVTGERKGGGYSHDTHRHTAAARACETPPTP